MKKFRNYKKGESYYQLFCEEHLEIALKMRLPASYEKCICERFLPISKWKPIKRPVDPKKHKKNTKKTENISKIKSKSKRKTRKPLKSIKNKENIRTQDCLICGEDWTLT